MKELAEYISSTEKQKELDRDNESSKVSSKYNAAAASQANALIKLKSELLVDEEAQLSADEIL
mgnify:CR=1 FL=1